MRINTIAAAELDNYIKKRNIMIIDLRSKDDYQKRHIISAINVPFAEIDRKNLNKNMEIILYCERGASSIVAASRLAQRGYNVKSVVGGISAYHGRFIG